MLARRSLPWRINVISTLSPERMSPIVLRSLAAPSIFSLLTSISFTPWLSTMSNSRWWAVRITKRFSSTSRATARDVASGLVSDARSKTVYRMEIEKLTALREGFEAVEIARKFSSEECGRFVNGVLDRIAGDVRRRPTAE